MDIRAMILKSGVLNKLQNRYKKLKPHRSEKSLTTAQLTLVSNLACTVSVPHVARTMFTICWQQWMHIQSIETRKIKPNVSACFSLSQPTTYCSNQIENNINFNQKDKWYKSWNNTLCLFHVSYLDSLAAVISLCPHFWALNGI
jgi:hypothetical protein